MLTSRVITTDDHQGLLTAPGMTYIIALPINEISLDSVSLPQCLFDFSIVYQDCGAMDLSNERWYRYRVQFPVNLGGARKGLRPQNAPVAQ